MANALISWLQLSAGAPSGQAQISWLQLSAAAAAGQAQISWLQLQQPGSGSATLVCAAGAFVISVAPSLALYGLLADAAAMLVTGRAATLRKTGAATALLGQLDGSAASRSIASRTRPAQLATAGRPAQ